MKRQLHLNLFISGKGHHEASWRHPDSSGLASTDIRYLQGLTQRAEQGLFDSIFLACLLYTSPSPRDQRGSGVPGCG